MGIAASLVLGLFFLNRLQFNDIGSNEDSVDLLTSNEPIDFDNLNPTENIKRNKILTLKIYPVKIQINSTYKW